VLLRVSLLIFGPVTVAVLIGQAIPVSSELDWKKPSKYAVQQKRFIALLGLTLASVILLCLLLGAAASPEIYFVLAIQRLRGLVEHGVSSEYMLAPELQAKLKSDVLPYVSQAYIDVSPLIFLALNHALLMICSYYNNKTTPRNFLPYSNIQLSFYQYLTSLICQNRIDTASEYLFS
jgi:hypothetical protein